jgi:hypothetical protein
MAEPKGKYVKHGDVEEWEWDKDGPGVPKLTGGYVVPESEFDPRSVETGDLKSPSEKVAEKAESKGLTLAEEPEPEKAEPEKKAEPKKVTTTTAKPLVDKK